MGKPRIRYEVHENRVHRLIEYVSLRRNEVANKLPVKGLKPNSRTSTASSATIALKAEHGASS